MSKLILCERLPVIAAVGVAICNRSGRFEAVDLCSRTAVSPRPRVLVKSMLSR